MQAVWFWSTDSICLQRKTQQKCALICILVVLVDKIIQIWLGELLHFNSVISTWKVEISIFDEMDGCIFFLSFFFSPRGVKTDERTLGHNCVGAGKGTTQRDKCWQFVSRITLLNTLLTRFTFRWFWRKFLLLQSNTCKIIVPFFKIPHSMFNVCIYICLSVYNY